MELCWEVNLWEEFAAIRVDTSQRPICWVELAGYVSSVDQTSTRSEDKVDSFENLVDLFVAAVPCPPALDDSSIVSEDLDPCSCRCFSKDMPDQ